MDKTKVFIDKAIVIHGNKYDYSLVDYKTSKETVKIKCYIHGFFEQSPNSHLINGGCKKCGVEKRASKCRNNLENFKSRANEIHSNKYDYSKAVYKNSINKIIIICPIHGEFSTTPKIHYKAECYKCSLAKTSINNRKPQVEFIRELIKRYGDKYDYSLINYVNSKVPVKIVCNKGNVINILPSSLLSNKPSAVKKVFIKKPTKSTDKNIFILEAIKVYGEKDDYTNTDVISSKDKIEVTCTIHNIVFNKSIQNYLSGHGCPMCSATNYRNLRALPKNDYYDKAREVHKDIYTYCDDYTTLKYAITFFCKNHGRQRRNAKNHLNGAGCKKCDIIGNKGDKLTREGYIKTANGRVTTLYLIECFDEKERFYKIGKTFRGVESRFKGKILPYNYNVIKLYNSTAEKIWDLEESIHAKYKAHSYDSSIKNTLPSFAGFSQGMN